MINYLAHQYFSFRNTRVKEKFCGFKKQRRQGKGKGGGGRKTTRLHEFPFENCLFLY